MPDTAEVPDTILVDRGPGETRSALLRGDALIEVVHARDGALQAGAVHLGRAGPPVPHMDAVFVHLGRPLPGVLKVKKPHPEGQAIAVTIAVPERSGKGAELKAAADVALPSTAATGALLRPAPEAAVLWWRAQSTTITDIRCAPPAEAARLAKLLGPETPLASESPGSRFFANADEAIEAALEKTVRLAGGGSLVIETTAAATTIDVNAGASPPDVANREAMSAIAAELRRRNLAGHILIDIIPRPQKAALVRILEGLLASDPVPARIAGLTPLGMIELTRERRGLSLAETLCETPNGAGPRLSAASVALKALREAVALAYSAKTAHVAIEVAQDVAALLAGALKGAVAEAEQASHGVITVSVRAGIAPERIIVRADGARSDGARPA